MSVDLQLPGLNSPAQGSKPKRSKFMLIGAAGIVLLTLVILAAFFAFKTPETTNSSSVPTVAVTITPTVPQPVVLNPTAPAPVATSLAPIPVNPFLRPVVTESTVSTPSGLPPSVQMQYAKINRLRAWHNRMAKAYPSETPPKSTDPTEKWIEVVNFYGSDVPRGMKDQSLGFKGDPTVADGVTNGPNDPLYPKRNTSGGLDTFFIGAGTTIGTLDGGIGRFWKTNHFYLPGSTTPQTRTIELTLYPFSDSFWTVVATLCPPKANTC